MAPTVEAEEINIYTHVSPRIKTLPRGLSLLTNRLWSKTWLPPNGTANKLPTNNSSEYRQTYKVVKWFWGQKQLILKRLSATKMF